MTKEEAAELILKGLPECTACTGEGFIFITNHWRTMCTNCEGSKRSIPVGWVEAVELLGLDLPRTPREILAGQLPEKSYAFLRVWGPS